MSRDFIQPDSDDGPFDDRAVGKQSPDLDDAAPSDDAIQKEVDRRFRHRRRRDTFIAVGFLGILALLEGPLSAVMFVGVVAAGVIVGLIALCVAVVIADWLSRLFRRLFR